MLSSLPDLMLSQRSHPPQVFPAVVESDSQSQVGNVEPIVTWNYLKYKHVTPTTVLNANTYNWGPRHLKSENVANWPKSPKFPQYLYFPRDWDLYLEEERRGGGVGDDWILCDDWWPWWLMRGKNGNLGKNKKQLRIRWQQICQRSVRADILLPPTIGIYSYLLLL